MHFFSNLFDKVLYVFRTYLLPIISSISTLYTQQWVQGDTKKRELLKNPTKI